MKTYISPFNNIIKILHFPGKLTLEKRLYLKVFSNFKNFKCPKDITIITTANEYFKKYAILIKQLNNTGVNFINCVPDGVFNWNNRYKIQYILDALKKVNTKYCLILDSFDVSIVYNLDTIIDDYLTYNVETLYNGTTEEFPNIQIEEIENRVENYGPYSFFNAGCCIGTTEGLLKVYDEAKQIVDNTNIDEDEHSSSEQYFLRKVYKNHLNDGLIGVDWQCKIFQCWRNLKQELLTFNGTGFEQKMKSSTNQDIVEKIIENNSVINMAKAAVDTDLTDEF